MEIDTSQDFNKNMDEDDDELDLVKLVATNANDANQYLVFVGSNDELYAKNVSKIEELVVYRDLIITKNTDKNSIVVGTANIRGQMTTIVNFDAWIGNEVLDDKDYELLIIANYGQRRFAIVVKKVEQITTIEPDEMTDNSNDNEKATFITKVFMNGKDNLCTIFDGDQMHYDIYNNIDTQNKLAQQSHSRVSSEKMVLFADDSRFVRKMVGELLSKMNLSYKLYEDGEEMLQDMDNLNPEDLGLIITDLEMPKMGGRIVITSIRKNTNFDDVNIIVHTNMSNNITQEELKKLGSSAIIEKIDMENLSSAISKYIR